MEKTVCLTACSGYDWETLCEAVAAQFCALGFDSLIRPGIRAVIKPNLVVKAAPEAGIATHPLLTAAVAVHLCDLGAQALIPRLSKNFPHGEASQSSVIGQGGPCPRKFYSWLFCVDYTVLR